MIRNKFDAKNETYNGIYAKKYADGIYVNTGIVGMASEELKKAPASYKKGLHTLMEFKKKVSKAKFDGAIVKIVKEKDSPYGTLYRLMTRLDR